MDKFELPIRVICQVSALIPEHRAPIGLWERAQRGEDVTTEFNLLAVRLSEGDVTFHALSLLAEAAQRAQDPAAKSLTEWQSWLDAQVEASAVADAPPAKLLDGNALRAQFSDRPPGPWMRTILDLVYTDQLSGEVTTEAAALARAMHYVEVFSPVVSALAEQEDISERVAWGRLGRLEDPREILQ